MFDLLCMWLRKFDIDYNEGDLMPRRWIAWGTCFPLSGRAEHRFRYFVVRFKFVSQWMFDVSRDLYCWHSPAIFKFHKRWGCFWYPSASHEIGLR